MIQETFKTFIVHFIDPLIMEGDSKNMIGWMDVSRAPWKLTNIIREIKELWGSRQIASSIFSIVLIKKQASKESTKLTCNNYSLFSFFFFLRDRFPIVYLCITSIYKINSNNTQYSTLILYTALYALLLV